MKGYIGGLSLITLNSIGHIFSESIAISSKTETHDRLLKHYPQDIPRRWHRLNLILIGLGHYVINISQGDIFACVLRGHSNLYKLFTKLSENTYMKVMKANEARPVIRILAAIMAIMLWSATLIFTFSKCDFPGITWESFAIVFRLSIWAIGLPCLAVLGYMPWLLFGLIAPGETPNSHFVIWRSKHSNYQFVPIVAVPAEKEIGS